MSLPVDLLCFDPVPQVHSWVCNRTYAVAPCPLLQASCGSHRPSLLRSLPRLIAVFLSPVQADTPCSTIGHSYQKTRQMDLLHTLCFPRRPNFSGSFQLQAPLSPVHRSCRTHRPPPPDCSKISIQAFNHINSRSLEVSVKR